ncbi:DegT/DnrJ/EryC1/StrS family aminotransferase [Aliiroseovarius sp. Z3]|uniref:DegT/DnrJ/EryC1/StrS family aminotransferase n=1 Tax=Aliiroseovarius sp. Z3 TaxID=2811402 RepID=UPI0023B2AD54|nr:DegT/DnrJ/EryC1/StrS family aminotransferase [Aliiroseovarius sp. Z3]MDE9449059.1 DegT/DnrJ/EryC1/StrS family aminotransferase [Aliiroseovarius sp. Z3]
MQFLDVGSTYTALKDEIDLAMSDVMAKGYFIGGPSVDRFEREFAAYCQAAHAVGAGNGLDALVLILRAMGIGPGDEVIVPAHTFIATWLAVSFVGAKPVPVDADWADMNMDLTLVEAAVTSRTRAIIVVHLYGNPADVSPLKNLCENNQIKLIEDAAQAHGACVGSAHVGSMCDAAAFSFYPGKNLGAFGDGGAITTNDGDLASACRVLGNYGSVEKYVHDVQGQNSRLDPLQSEVLSVKLKVLGEWNGRRRQIASRYLEAFAELKSLTLPTVAAQSVPVWHLFVVRHSKRDLLEVKLRERGIPTLKHYPIPNHKAGAYVSDFAGTSFPVTEKICAQCLSLPIGPHMSDDEVDDVIGAMRDVVPKL